MKRLTVSCLILICFFAGLKAQSTIMLINGKAIPALSYQFDSLRNLLQYETMHGKNKKAHLLDGSEVYSVFDAQQIETVIYKPQDAEQFSTFEMRYVVQGEAIAYNEYKPIWPLVAGFVVGFGSMMLPVNPMLGLSLPIAYNVGIAFVKPCDHYVLKHYPVEASDELFVYGYKQHAKNKILKRSILGTVTGIAAGIGTSLILSYTK